MSKNRKNDDDKLTDDNLSEAPDETQDNAGAEKLITVEGDDIETLRTELDSQKDKYIRLVAEFDNYRKRTAKENLEVRMTASRDLIQSLLEILDDAERAEMQIKESKDDDQLLQGIMLIFNKLKKMLEQKGLKAIETLGTEFDVEKDEAVSEVPVSDAAQKGKVIAEVQKGYTLNDRIIRFAKVVVGK